MVALRPYRNLEPAFVATFVAQIVPDQNWTFLSPQRDRCPRCHVIHTVSRPLGEILKKCALDERDSIVDSDIGYKMLGKELLILLNV